MLFEPLKIKSMTLQNRIVLPAMVTRLAGLEEGFVTRDILDRYRRYAQGEPGLIVMEAMAIHRSKSGYLLRVCDDQFIPGLRSVVDQVHAVSGSKIVPQILHFLKVSKSGWRQTVDQLTKEEIREIVDGFASAAYRVREAGFDGVELHMAHAYTLAQFLSPRSNTRKDEYGRTLEGRLRLPYEVLTAVRGSVGDDFPVGLRMVGDEYIKNGFTGRESPMIALRLAEMGAAYISVSAGGKFEDAIVTEGRAPNPYSGYSGDRCMPGKEFPDGLNLGTTRGIKSFLACNGYGHVPVIAAGKISGRQMAEEVLTSGVSDLVGLARPLLADPDLPKKWRDGQDEKVVVCIYCNVCKSLDMSQKQVRCGSLWPNESLHAPENFAFDPEVLPGGAGLTAEVRGGSLVRLKWTHAGDASRVSGFDIFRSQDGLTWERIWAGHISAHLDQTARAGTWYYKVQAFDTDGNRAPYSNMVEVEVSDPGVPAAVGAGDAVEEAEAE